MRSEPISQLADHVNNLPLIFVDQLRCIGQRAAQVSKFAARCCAVFSIDGKTVANVCDVIAKRSPSLSFGQPIYAGLRRLRKPFSANLQAVKGFSFVQDGQAGPSFAHLAACGLKVQVS